MYLRIHKVLTPFFRLQNNLREFTICTKNSKGQFVPKKIFNIQIQIRLKFAMTNPINTHNKLYQTKSESKIY